MQTTDDCKGVYHEVGSFTPYTLNSNIWVIPTGLIAGQSWLQRTNKYISGLIPMGPLVLESSHACHLHYDLVLQGDLLAPFRACSLRATISKTIQSSPQHAGSGVSQVLQANVSPHLCYSWGYPA